LNVCGGAQRSISLATGTFTGESTRNPPEPHLAKKRYIFNGLRNHDLGLLDSFAEARESTLRKPPLTEATSRKPPAKNHQSHALWTVRGFRGAES